MRVLGPRASLLVVAACSLPVYDDSAGPTAGSTSAGGTTTGAPTSSAGGSTAAAASSGGVSIPDAGAKECDVWVEDCPEGQKCMPYSGDGDNSWESLKCVPIDPDPDQVGEPCTVVGSTVSGEDSCDKHTMCWGVSPDTNTGMCVAMCTGTPSEPTCAEPYEGCVVANQGVLILCFPQCDPLAQDCPQTSDMCIWLDQGGFLCVLDAVRNSSVFYSCSFANECHRGQYCGDPALAAECDPMGPGCCLPFCDVDEPNTCPGVGQECVPWYEDPADAAPFNVDVGLCSLP